ncbi:methyltransferase domain-containing protein [Mycena rosella]|uniref:Methyltransferase domain-containing protein n=1 Tax=Mycena rosella TaxID=1033263 RepID=A0AAD7DNW0_MYCRO|nr:methyltransferase domain-containing protein [Mycena rosella]
MAVLTNYRALLSTYRARIAVGAAILIVWALYAYSTAYQPAPSFTGPALRQLLRQSEEEYQESVRNRAGMIRKYGPTAAEVDSFPSHGEFYTLWDFFPPAYQCPHRVQRLGTMGDGGKYICGIERVAAKPACVVYSFGINSESSFEADIMRRAPSCEVWGYDYSVPAFGPEITTDTHLAPRAHFFPYALGGTDAHTADPPMWTLQGLMRANGHSFIDILKIDIEGSEFATLTAVVDAFASKGALPFGQLQLEIHATPNQEHTPFPVFLKWWERLEHLGLRPFFSEPNLVYINLVRGVPPDLIEYSFINTWGSTSLLRISSTLRLRGLEPSNDSWSILAEDGVYG